MKGPDSQRTRLRALVSIVDGQISRLASAASTADGQRQWDVMAASWAELVGLLALGAPPESQECPVCGQSGTRGATRCGYCWSKLPLAAAAP